MKSENAIKTGYVPVKELEVGDTIINLGIIKNIFPNQPDGSTKIIFNPKRSRSAGGMNYLPSDKLKVA